MYRVIIHALTNANLGVTDAADKMEKKIRDQKEKRLKDESGMPLYFTKKNLTDVSICIGKPTGGMKDFFFKYAKLGIHISPKI